MCDNEDKIYDQITKWLKSYGITLTQLQDDEVVEFVEKHFGKENIPKP